MAFSRPVKNIHEVSARELFRYEGCAFVEMLYRVVLKRPPDEAGFAYHLNNLLVRGHSKEQILTAFLESDEAKTKGLDEGFRFLSDEGGAEAENALSPQADGSKVARAERPRARECARIEPDRRTYTIKDLCALDGPEFVVNAYRCLLKREPDEGGFSHYLPILTSRLNGKSVVLCGLMYSAEAAAVGVKVSGMAGLRWRVRLLRLPVVGALIQYTLLLQALPQPFLQLRRFGRELESISADHDSIVGQLLEELAKIAARDALKAGRWELEDAMAANHGALERLAAQRFADRRELAAALAQKADREEVAGMERQGAAEREQLAAAVAQKAEREEVARLERQVTAEQAQLTAGLGQKADREEVARLEQQRTAERSQLTTAMAQKAEREEVARLEQQWAAEREQLAAALATKADARVMAEISGQKANSDWVHHLEVNKAEARALNDLETRYIELAAHVQHSGEILADIERQINVLFDEVSRRSAEVPAEPEGPRATLEHETWNGRLYAAFEDQFRGGTEDIKSRESIYLPYIRERTSPNAKHPVIDIGCGRGEWLELLRENGLSASGVDSNRTMIKRCLELGLNVAEADGVEYLRSLRPRSAVAITAFHVVEHLPMSKLLGLLAQAFRVLRPGGRLILETPNPANVLVGSCNFYLDPTHIRPLPSALLRFLVQTRGFADVEIQELHPMAEHMRLAGSEVAERMNQHFYGAQDYAVLASKP